jgi:type VI secretion system protein ImpL
MTTFAYELATLVQAQAQTTAGDPEGRYSLPWYLVVGEPGSGRSTAIKALNLSWPRGDQPLALGQPQPQCTYWLPAKAVFIEPGPTVLGPNRQSTLLAELCEELKVKRPREPIDGIVLIVSAALLADFEEDAVDRYAKSLRRYLIEIGQALGADVPAYVVVTAFDTLWGFGDAFKWSAERRNEQAWGFSLPPGLTTAETPARVKQELEGLVARIEAMGFAKLASEEPPEERARGYQLLAEARDVLARLGDVMQMLTMANAFERAPWIRSLALGSGIPGTGNRLRHRVIQFSQMGYYPSHQSGTPQPGGMPLHAVLDDVLLPERDIVPTRVRWRDDRLLVVLTVLGAVGWIAILVALVVRTLL